MLRVEGLTKVQHWPGSLLWLVYIKQVSRTAFFNLLNIVEIRNILSQIDAEKLLHAFVTSRLDYCNSLLLGCPTYSLKSLQLIQNAAARVLMRTNRRDHISPVLDNIEFEIIFLTSCQKNSIKIRLRVAGYNLHKTFISCKKVTSPHNLPGSWLRVFCLTKWYYCYIYYSCLLHRKKKIVKKQ